MIILMAIEIGRGYMENKARLREDIYSDKANAAETTAGNNACYFCCKKIIGKMVVITESNEINKGGLISTYFLDDICYNLARNYIYYKGMPVQKISSEN